jgi:hypothetical protein
MDTQHTPRIPTDDEIENIVMIDDAAERYIAEQRLAKDCGIGVGIIRGKVKAILKALKANKAGSKKQPLYDDPDLIALFEELNETFAVISMNGAVRVLREKEDGKDFELMKDRDFNLWLADQGKIPVSEKRVAALSVLWLEWPGHRKFDGVCFEPGVFEPQGSKYNFWRGWGVEPSEQGSCELFKRHLRDNVFPSDELYDFAWKLNAHRFQFPRIKPTVAIATIGDEGTGKSYAAEKFGKLHGGGYVPVTRDQLAAPFNGFMQRITFAQYDEAIYAHDHKLVPKIMNEVTCKTRLINDKGEKVVHVNAYDFSWFTANKRDALPALPGSRRWFISDVLPTHKEDTDYFAAIEKELDEGGYERLLWELLHTDLTDFDPNKCPKTEALSRAIQEVLPVEMTFLIDMANTLELWDDDDGDAERDADAPRHLVETCVPAVTLRELFFKYAGKRHLNSRATETKLGALWAGFGFVGGVKVRLERETWVNGKLRASGERVNGYKLPDPQELRDKLIEKLQLPKDCFDNGAKFAGARKAEPEARKPHPLDYLDAPLSKTEEERRRDARSWDTEILRMLPARRHNL